MVGLLFVPTVQTEVAHELLGRRTGKVQITVDFVSTGLNSAHLEGVHITGGGFDLVAPVVDIDLPVAEFLLHRRANIRRLVAKGWTAKGLEEALTLSGSPLPWRVSVGDADLEGEVMVTPGRGKSAVPVDVTIKGGGLTPVQNGSFALDASGVFLTEDMRQISASVDGTLSLGLGPNQRPTRLSATLMTKGGGFDALSGLTLTAEVGSASSRVALSRGARRLLALDGGEAGGRWTLALESADVAPFLADNPPPPFSASGAGDYRWDDGKGVLSATGEVSGSVNGWPVSATVALRRHGHELRIASLSGAVANIRVTALQSFAIDETTHAVTFDHPAGDLAQLALEDASLDRLPPLPLLGTAFRATGGRATGKVVVTGKGDQAYAVRSLGAIELKGAAVARGGQAWADGIDGTLALSGSVTADQWEIDVSSLALARHGEPLLSGNFSATRSSAADQPWLVQGKLASGFTLGDLGPAQSTVDFNGLAGAGLKLDGTVAIQADNKRSVTGSYHLTIDEDGGAQLTLPINIAFGEQKTDLVLDGTQVRDESGERWYLKITGGKAITDQLKVLAGPLLARIAQARPFWGTGVGRLGITLDRVEYPGGAWAPLDALVALTPTQVEFKDVRVGLDATHTVAITGGIAYHAAESPPYAFSASLEMDRIESGPLFPAKHGDPLVEGRFKVKRTFSSSGGDLAGLIAHPLQTIEASSATSIVRVLAVNVGDAVPQHRTSVGKEAENTAAGVASLIFATHRNPLEGGKNPITPQTEAILDFTDDIDEVGFDRLTVVAAEQPDGSYVISRIDGATDELKVTGTGRIGGKSTDPLGKRPLALELRVALRGHLAALLAKGGVITPSKDKQAYVPIPHVVHLGGTVGQIDATQWHDLLAAAIKRS